MFSPLSMSHLFLITYNPRTDFTGWSQFPTFTFPLKVLLMRMPLTHIIRLPSNHVHDRSSYVEVLAIFHPFPALCRALRARSLSGLPPAHRVSATTRGRHAAHRFRAAAHGRPAALLVGSTTGKRPAAHRVRITVWGRLTYHVQSATVTAVGFDVGVGG